MGNKAAFCVIQETRRGKGSAPIAYPTALLPSTHWNVDTFMVPRDGIYFFGISFMRDQTVQGDGHQGKGDDCNVQIWINNEPKAGAYVRIGESTVPRVTASGQFFLDLKKGDLIKTFGWMAQESEWVFQHCVFTGYRVAKT